LGDEVIASVIQGKMSLSAGQFHYETDGFRENNDQRQNIYNLFAQYELSPKTSIQAEFRSRDFNSGDLQLLFDPKDFLPDLREDDQTKSVRLGLHHSFSPNSDLIASVIYVHSDTDYFVPGFDIKGEGDGILAEVQHIFRMEKFSIISGAGRFDEVSKEEDIFSGESTTTKTSPYHTNLYLYSQINYPKQITWTIGGSGDFFKGWNADKIVKRDQFNPKFGLTWNMFPGTTLRAAVFRVLKRSLLTDQTIEPTQVAGFNQFFDDPIGTDAWRYGIGIDQKFSSQLYGGVDFSKRDFNVPGLIYENDGSTRLIEADLDEKIARAYMFWTPHHWLALSTEYQYEQFKNPPEMLQNNIAELNTHRVLFGINFFHPSGFSLKLSPQYIYQNGDFLVSEFFPSGPVNKIVPKDDHFWVFDASVSYRFPKRLGILTIAAKNLFNEKFNFQDTDPSNPTIQPKRLILAKITLAF